MGASPPDICRRFRFWVLVCVCVTVRVPSCPEVVVCVGTCCSPVGWTTFPGTRLSRDMNALFQTRCCGRVVYRMTRRANLWKKYRKVARGLARNSWQHALLRRDPAKDGA